MPNRGPNNNSGGPNAPRRPNGNIDWDRVLREHLLPVIERQRAPNTIRGIMYILKSKGILVKSDYNVLDKHLVNWRLDRIINWNDIADGSGRAVTGTVRAYVQDRHIRISYNRGNNGWGWAYQYANHLKNRLYYENIKTGRRDVRKIYVWYLGDDDKQGRHMDYELKRQLGLFGILQKIHFQRIAVLPEHVQEYDLPTADEGGGYDIDALNAFNPELFEQLLLDHIDPYFDKDIHAKVLDKYTPENIDELVRLKVKFLD